MNMVIIKEAKSAANQLRFEGEESAANAIDSIIEEIEQDEKRHAALSTLKKGDKVVMHTCVEASNPNYLGKVWTCKTDAFRHKGHNYCSIFLEGFSGSFSADFLQFVNITINEAQTNAIERALQDCQNDPVQFATANDVLGWVESTTGYRTIHD
ncbi:hypothetical protein [Bacillus sp. FJAT-28004]|uniref:hypothetical protein n=1 Tax=Bacillus sp. FJAT-28004 TaxID=1679165 RepID=UPI0006B5C536|nr:hypothetical protein [Bacillus sp. FJAT-28004]